MVAYRRIYLKYLAREVKGREFYLRLQSHVTLTLAGPLNLL